MLDILLSKKEHLQLELEKQSFNADDEKLVNEAVAKYREELVSKIKKEKETKASTLTIQISLIDELIKEEEEKEAEPILDPIPAEVEEEEELEEEVEEVEEETPKQEIPTNTMRF